MTYIEYERNAYYNPEAHSLTIFGEADAGGSYHFDKFVVWKTSEGDYIWGTDSGCSCPSPFEEFVVANAARGNAHDVLVDLRAWSKSDAYHDRKTAAANLRHRLVDLI
jgi:hypothetical protein